MLLLELSLLKIKHTWRTHVHVVQISSDPVAPATPDSACGCSVFRYCDHTGYGVIKYREEQNVGSMIDVYGLTVDTLAK